MVTSSYFFWVETVSLDGFPILISEPTHFTQLCDISISPFTEMYSKPCQTPKIKGIL